MKIASIILSALLLSGRLYANVETLADAIRIEEGSNPRWLYGIHHKENHPLSEPEARRRCIATIRHAERDWSKQGDFVEFLARRYCPANWKSWAANVHRIETRLKINQK